MKGLLIAAGVLFLLFLVTWSSYNGMVGSRNAVDRAWSDVEASYQRRLDTIPKFAKNAQFSADFQLKLATDYAKYREGVDKAAANGDPGALQQAANNGYNALLIAIRQEAVPQAKTDQLTELNAQIENVERVINHDRRAYNEAVLRYNNRVQSFPGNVFAGMFGFEPRKGFKAEPEAEKSPDYDFGFGK